MSSVITNRSALQALQAANAAGRELAAAQKRVSTGLKVAGAKDNGAVYAIAQGMRAEISGWSAAAQSLHRAASGLAVTAAAVAGVNDLLVEMRELALAYADPSLSDTSRRALKADLEARIRQIDDQARAASFDGLNFLNGVGVEAAVASTSRYSLPSSSRTPLSFLTPMSSGANTTVSRSLLTQTSYAIPRSPLTPDSFAAVVGRSQMAAGSSASVGRQVYGGPGAVVVQHSDPHLWPSWGSSGRVDVWLDAFATGNAFEIWQGGQRVAASGQPYAAGAGPVAAGDPVSGQTMLSFDYDPALGRNYEIRAIGGGAWAFEYNHESGPGSAPRPAPTAHSVGVVSRSQWATPPPVELHPETSGPSPAQNGVAVIPADGGVHAGRVDLVFDAFETPDVVEIWQNGVRVAATGQPGAAGGAAVGAGSPVSGQQVLSFDYDPANGQALEFRFNDGAPHAGAGWVIGGLELYAAGAPPTTAAFTTTTTQSVSTFTSREAFDSVGLDPNLLTPETEATGGASRTYVIDAGEHSGRVDLWVDAYQDADAIEIWQNGVRVAASGQAYVPGGGAVPDGIASDTDVFLSFDYDPVNGQELEFRFNPGEPGKIGAWTVGGLVLQEPGAPLPETTRPSAFITPELGEVFPDIGFTRTSEGEPLLISSRNLTAAGLRLAAVDWDDPPDLLARIEAATRRAISAAAYYGSQQSLIETSLRHVTRLQDTLKSGVGSLVDADLARESARLQAAQVRQQLAAQTLSIANAEPRWILNLFRS